MRENKISVADQAIQALHAQNLRLICQNDSLWHGYFKPVLLAVLLLCVGVSIGLSIVLLFKMLPA